MSDSNYHVPIGGLPPQTQLLTGRSITKTSYAVIPGSVLTDIVTSQMPFWSDARFWVIARPMSGFSETFSQYIAEVQPGGGSNNPDPDETAQAVLFVVGGSILLTVNGKTDELEEGGYAFIPAGSDWSVWNPSEAVAQFHWIRKAYEAVEGLDLPDAVISSDKLVNPTVMPDTDGKWSTTRFIDPMDLRYDMNVNIVTLEPGAVIPFMETHVMEHGLFVLEGKAVYKLNDDWVEIEAGDFMWLRAFCPQACYAGGPRKFRYLLYKNVNRHMKLDIFK